MALKWKPSRGPRGTFTGGGKIVGTDWSKIVVYAVGTVLVCGGAYYLYRRYQSKKLLLEGPPKKPQEKKVQNTVANSFPPNQPVVHQPVVHQPVVH